MEKTRLVFSRFFDLRGNLGNVKEQPTRKTCFACEMKRLALRIYLAKFCQAAFLCCQQSFYCIFMRNKHQNGGEYLKRAYRDPRKTGKPGPQKNRKTRTLVEPYKNQKARALVGPQQDPRKTGKPGPQWDPRKTGKLGPQWDPQKA